MSLLTYSHTLVPLTFENINDVQDMFNDITAVVNGNIDATNLATSAKPATLLGTYVSYAHCAQSMSNGSHGSAGLYYSSAGQTWAVTAASSGAGPLPIVVNTANLTVSGLTPMMRVRATSMWNATSPAVTATFGLYPYTSSGGVGVLNATLGTVVSGSTTGALATTASTVSTVTGSDFALPADGVYTLGLTLSGGIPATNARGSMCAYLDIRWV